MQLLRKIAYPFALIYGLVVHVRNYLYDINVFSSTSFNTPTICVGNLSVGGTGKTPMIEFLIRTFCKQYRIAVLSRGYRRKSSGFQMANAASTVAQLGDEPFQIYRNYPNTIVAVDADRANGIERLENEQQPEMILLDDAFQHRKVKASCNILLTAFDNLYSEDTFLPTGSLRDSKNQAKRAHIIVVTKCPSKISNKDKLGIRTLLNPSAKVPVLFASFGYDHFVDADGIKLNLEAIEHKKVALVTGIANAGHLLRHLNTLNLNFDHLEYADHHLYKNEDVRKFNTYDIVLTTQKDFVKLEAKVDRLYYLGVRHQFLNEEDQLIKQLILTIIKRRHEPLT
ncbi:MAG: tetraacyldisaccharide 4'-kinase [Croceitalea sp.]|nr:tetraacyldisaccharide 4'-kinase [Croceitalea sp.]MBT8237719.1 tetraacyldisaccharide 4'-kinase [Croceitalea sp.]NNC35015.1 tetraacyldisaccharide 4'-kinase [Croceitalea sp.]NNL07859.1 tetraacyldisaccharide 4'-kinase [Croceitalea sp.]